MKKFRIFSLLLTICLLLTACGSDAPVQSDSDDEPPTQQSQTGGQESGITSDSEMFTDRDLRTTYDEGKAAIITLTGSGAECSSDAVSIKGSTDMFPGTQITLDL